MTTHEVLVKARALIERPESWCQHAQAYTAGGSQIDALDPAAASFCGVGAIIRAKGNEDCRSLLDFMAEVVGVKGEAHFFHWNDSHPHAEVLAAFDKAIAATAPEPDTSFLNEVEVEEPVAS